MSFTATRWLSSLDTKLSSPERAALFVLADLANDAGYCWPSRRYIAERLSLTMRTITRIIAKLIEKGLLRSKDRKSRSGLQTSNGYSLPVSDGIFRPPALDENVHPITHPSYPVRSFSANATKEGISLEDEVINSEVKKDNSIDSLVINTAREAENEQPSEFRGLRCDRGEAERIEQEVCEPSGDRTAGLEVPSGVEAARGVFGLQRRRDGANHQRDDGAGNGEHALFPHRDDLAESPDRDFHHVEVRKTATVLGQSQRAAFIFGLLPHLRRKWVERTGD